MDERQFFISLLAWAIVLLICSVTTIVYTNHKRKEDQRVLMHPGTQGQEAGWADQSEIIRRLADLDSRLTRIESKLDL